MLSDARRVPSSWFTVAAESVRHTGPSSLARDSSPSADDATRAIVARHELNIDEMQREWGWVNDKAKNEHHTYSGKAPGTSFAGVPVLWAHVFRRRDQLLGPRVENPFLPH